MHQLFDLSGRVAVVTGATKGMGLAIATALGAAGAKLVITGRTDESAKSAADQLRDNEKINVQGIGCDITDMESVKRFAKQSQEVFGQVDILVLNAAGALPAGSILKQGLEELGVVVNSYLNGNLLLVNELLPPMINRKEGSLLFTSSITAMRGAKILGMYGMAKAATDQLVRNLVLEIGASNVNVNSINPGAIRTDFSRILWEDPEREKITTSAIPLGRIGEPSDIAGLALLLVSQAGRYITGQNILVDGGRSAV